MFRFFMCYLPFDFDQLIEKTSGNVFTLVYRAIVPMLRKNQVYQPKRHQTPFFKVQHKV
ncbi:hypothetical protein [Methylovulum psychrotolerans]|uniref:Uncharacterized protein n=1 Tax=Methylovulum psychrotolerans TaxID=1704499 RepID=A0A2S5CGD6_9GAMM|nr:hypothetical protein [Methylovulum psychrotolerans]POZ49873.1 hypothetical protein AADEFJLK_04319 [Methylovulum psychrotolerans]